MQNNLQMLRKWRNYTQIKLSELSKVSVATIRKIERYPDYITYVPSYIVRRKLCKALDVDVKKLIFKKENDREVS